MTRTFAIWAFLLLLSAGCASQKNKDQDQVADTPVLRMEEGENGQVLRVFRAGEAEAILTQHARADFRPYLHPIAAPDGKGVLTEYSPGHHKHQTGLYWGFTRVNGRDYFHNPSGGYWRRVSAKVVTPQGPQVRWQTVYDLLDEQGQTLLTETQNWSMRQQQGRFLLDLEWRGEAKTDVTIGKYDYGGLFLRMPWQEGMAGEVVNATRQRNQAAEGQKAIWVDVGLQVPGRDNLAHITLFDHPDNKGFPNPWRVDSQMGIGPARARSGDWQIPQGETEVIRHQVVVHTGELDPGQMTKAWRDYTGNSSTYALWQVAQQEGRSAKFLSPEEAVKSMTLLPGFKVNAWASEPMMTQPMAFCWDDRGRLWVAENRDYESRGQGFSNAGDSRILILEDTDRDGVADSRKVFLEGIAFPAALAVGFGGVFVGAPPNLLFVPDRNGDDRADEADIEVRLTGWGIRDRHETLNSLHWGPDGWLYGLQGFATPSKVRKPQGKGRLYKHKDPFPDDLLQGEGVDINGGVWRYHPTKDRFEVVAHGFSNPWGIDYDAKGQLLISACVIPHLWHVVPGGIYHRQGGQHFNPYVYDDIKTIADHRHQSAHGGARIYQSDAFPQSQHGRIFMANIHEHAVLSDVLVPKGSGFSAHHGDEVLRANNAQWVGFSMEQGPEGALYVLDWHDADICGQAVLNEKTGRIFRIMPGKSQAKNFKGRYDDLAKMSDQQLVGMQTVQSDWHARRARVLLQHRAAQGKLAANTHAQLRKIFEGHAHADWRLRAMWALHVTGGFSRAGLVQALADKDPYVRAWAIQLLCEDQAPGSEALAAFARMARADPSPVVRLYLASALPRLPVEARWLIAGELAGHSEDAPDHNLPKMIWFGLEPLVAQDPARALALATRGRLPVITRYVARRCVDAEALEPLVAAIGRQDKSQLALLEGMRQGMEGRYDVAAPANWGGVYTQLKSQGEEVAQMAQDLAQQFGDAEAAQKSLAVLRNRLAPLAQRRQALRTLAAQQRPELARELPQLLEEAGLRADAIRAVAGFEQEKLGKLLLARYPGFGAADKLLVVQTLASRPKYGWLLTQAIKDNSVPKREVPPYVARQLLRVVGSGFVEVWGPIEQSSVDEQAYAKYRKLLTDKSIAGASAVKGRAVFQRTCGSCHKMYGQGGLLGPDLTGSNRSDTEYLLFNVLNPSGEIQDDYKLVVVNTRDGRTYSGNVVAETARQLTLRVVGQDAVVINKSHIQSREVTPVSMMPPGLFNSLTDAEVLDLAAYLRTSQQVGLENEGR
ncbi:MAG: PVC-type heme-binding CxxCH protein [Adhaeribacter sp.]